MSVVVLGVFPAKVLTATPAVVAGMLESVMLDGILPLAAALLWLAAGRFRRSSPGPSFLVPRRSPLPGFPPPRAARVSTRRLTPSPSRAPPDSLYRPPRAPDSPGRSWTGAATR